MASTIKVKESQIRVTSNPAILAEIIEYDQSVCVRHATYINTKEDDGSFRIDVIPGEQDGRDRLWSWLEIFLPAGYPGSVTSDYLGYQFWDSLQAFSSSIAGLLASRAVLEGIGVGDTNASPTAALLLSVLQDSAGRLATIVFATRFGTSLEPECKMYRLMADIFNDAAMILDCLSPAIPKRIRVGVLSFSSVLRALCGVTAGSAKASLSAHFAKNGNIGELNAKDSSQETVISLIGMLAGSWVVSHISSRWATWIAMMLLLSIHLGTNYLAVRSVAMRTLNRQRANILLSRYILACELSDIKQSKRDLPVEQHKFTGPAIRQLVLNPRAVSASERIFERDGVLRWCGGPIIGKCRIGVDMKTILNSIQKHNTASSSYRHMQIGLIDLMSISKYIIWWDIKQDTILIALNKQYSHAEPWLKIVAWLHALRFARIVQKDPSLRRSSPKQVCELLRNTNTSRAELDALKMQMQVQGWNIDAECLEVRPGPRAHITGGFIYYQEEQTVLDETRKRTLEIFFPDYWLHTERIKRG